LLTNVSDGPIFPLEVTGEQMRTIRLVNGWTQDEVAAALDVTRSYVCLLESGKRRINRRTAVAFAVFVNAMKDARSKVS
jgi:transcriptional regulator with XRE-family HTH domain